MFIFKKIKHNPSNRKSNDVATFNRFAANKQCGIEPFQLTVTF